MPINEQFQQLGHWEIRFKKSTPRDVFNAVTYWDTVSVCPVRLSNPDRATVLATARYSGRVDEFGRQDARTLGGPSILAWLGDQNGMGSFQHFFTGTGNFSVGNKIGIGISAGHPEYSNGLTLGSVVGLSANLTKDTVVKHEAPRAIIERSLRLSTVTTEYRCRPDGVIDFQKAGDNYAVRSTPQVLITKGPGGRWGNIAGFHAVELGYDLATDKLATDITCTGNAGAVGAASTIFTRPKCFDGVTDAHVEAHITANTDVNADCDIAALNALTYDYTPSWRFRCRVDVVDPGRWVVPGDYLWLYNLELDLFNLATQISWNGSVVFPATLRLFGMNWGICPGMGLYLIQSSAGTNGVVDLTDWIDWSFEPDLVDLTIGTAALGKPGAIDSQF